jgi:hypothetical protein
MKRTATLEYEGELFDQVEAILGTEGLAETVRRAFEEVITLRARQRAIEQLQTTEGLDLDREDVMRDAWP